MQMQVRTTSVAVMLLSLLYLPLTIASEFGTSKLNGQTRLLGNSFGTTGLNRTFDYVVIGGGNSGLTLAARLAENPKISVAVVEAGTFYEISGSGNYTQIPAYEALFASAPPTIDWGVVTPPQAQLNNRSIKFAQGKCFGGGSTRNGMVYQRSTIGAYKLWADTVGDSSWEFDNLLPFFQKSVNFTPPDYQVRGGPVIAYDPAAYIPSGGPLKVAYWNYYVPIASYVRAGLEKLGFKENSGINTGSILGFAQWPATIDPDVAVRDSSQTSFGAEAIGKTTLQIYPNTLAKKILFNGKTATGVTVVTSGVAYNLLARKEVILAAGSFRSPQLLMVSGVGPRNLLQSLDIPLVAELPGLGQNLWDQPSFTVVVPINITSANQLFSNATYLAESEQQYLSNQTGHLSIFSSNYLAWEHLPNASLARLSGAARDSLAGFPADWPDLQYVPNDLGPITAGDTGNYMTIAVTMEKTTAHGTVSISSTDTTINPLVNVNWLGSTIDQEVAVEGVRRARDLVAAIGLKAGPEIRPGDNVTTYVQILEYLRNGVTTINHPAGTCKMGKSSDGNAVVDSNGLVLGGVKGLRVVDASIIPILPPGQPMATVYLIAEKLAAVILATL